MIKNFLIGFFFPLVMLLVLFGIYHTINFIANITGFHRKVVFAFVLIQFLFGFLVLVFIDESE